MCSDWLSCNHGDGSTSRILPEVNFDSSLKIYMLKQQQNVFHRHLVMSLFRKNSASPYTRLQRVAVLCVMFFLMMISSAMWYGTEQKVTVTFKFQVGPISMGLNEFYVGCITILTVYPFVILISELFRRTKKINDKCSEETFEILDEIQERKFPRWVLVVAWILVFVAVVMASFFTFLYSLDWGDDKSNEWLGAFFLSFLQALLLVDPFVVSTSCSIVKSTLFLKRMEFCANLFLKLISIFSWLSCFSSARGCKPENT